MRTLSRGMRNALAAWICIGMISAGLAWIVSHPVRAQSQITPPIPVSVVESCGTTVACAGTVTLNVKLVYGSAPLTSGSPSTATLTGLPFTSATTYSCAGTDATTATNNLIKFANASGASTVITGPATVTDSISYICTGN